MDLSDVPLFALADRRLAWVNDRQSLLAQNVANADTPNWRAQDLKPFDELLNGATLAMAHTNSAHLGGANPAAGNPVVAAQERAPDGNAVVLDKELIKIAATDAAHDVVMSVTKKYIGMVKTSIGH